MNKGRCVHHYIAPNLFRILPFNRLQWCIVMQWRYLPGRRSMTEETGSLRSTRVSLTSSGRKGNRQQQHHQAVQQAGHAQVLLKSPAINRLYQLDLQSCRLLLNLKRQSLHLHYLLLPGPSSVSPFETLFQSPTPVGIVLGELTEPVTAIKVGMSDVGQHFAHRCHFSPNSG